MLRIDRELLARFQSLIALALMVLVMSLLSERFLTAENGWNILRQISVNLCLSIGMTLIILSAGIDLSVGAVLALSGAVAAGLLKNGVVLSLFAVRLEFTVFGALVAGLLVGAAAGWFNGLAITRFRLPPFVATLGMFSMARGLTMLWTGGFPITGLGAEFGFLGTGVYLGIPMPVWITGTLVVVFLVVTRRTRFGRYVYAGLIVTARLDSAQPNAGLGYELDSIAAVVIGGTSLSGGRGSVLGTVLGCLIIGVLNNGLFLLDVSPFWQQVVKGLVILAAVAIDKMSSREA